MGSDRTSTEVRSPTSTSTEVRSPTSTSTDAYTQGNITVTGGAGAGAYTVVNVFWPFAAKPGRADGPQYQRRSEGVADRMSRMIDATMRPRAMSPIPEIMESISEPKPAKPFIIGGIAIASIIGAIYLLSGRSKS